MRDVQARETAASYDRIVASYEAQASQPSLDRTAFFETFALRLRRGGVVLDAGCGPGHDMEALHARGLRALGIDSSLGMARRTRDRGHQVVVADVRRVPLVQGCLDGLWSSASLLHVPRPEVPATLATWQRLLRPGGVFGLITSLGDDEGWEAVPYKPASQHGDVLLRRWFVHHDRDALTQLVSTAGFHIEQAEVREGNRRWLQLLALKRG